MSVEKQVKVSLWCVQRTMSTVLAKCLSAIDDIEVYLSLFSYASFAASFFESETGRPFPPKLDGNEADYEKAIEIWKKKHNSTLVPRRISMHEIRSDLENTKRKFVFVKEVSSCQDRVKEYLPQGFRYAFLIRDPSSVYSSWRRGLQSSESVVPPDGVLDIIRDDPFDTHPFTWYQEQHQLWKYVKKNLDPNPVIIDSFDLASQPQKTLKAFCDAVGFPYSDDLLQWSPSQDIPANVVASGDDLFKGLSSWFEKAFSSTHFETPKGSGSIPRDQLTPDVIHCVDFSMPFYRELSENKLEIL